MKKLEFDFNNEWIKVPEAQAKFDEWYETNIESAPVVYEKPGYHIWTSDNVDHKSRHCARLIDIQEIKKECKHELSSRTRDFVHYCAHCDVELVADWRAKE